MKKQFPRTALRGVAMALALAGLFGSADLVASSGVEPSGRRDLRPAALRARAMCAAQPSPDVRPCFRS